MESMRRATSTVIVPVAYTKKRAAEKRQLQEVEAALNTKAEFDAVTLSKFEKEEVSALPDEVTYFILFYYFIV